MMTTEDSLRRPYSDQIRNVFHEQKVSLVIVDDDPTGTQTAHDVPVLGHWTREAFVYEFSKKTPLFFVLANTRSLPLESATERAREIGENLVYASQKTGRRYLLISRSDSTLRGYFPSEVEALSQGAGLGNLPTLSIPAFFEGGRITENNTHYIVEGGHKIPVSETVFAQDKSFGYGHSDLTKWVEEKSAGKIKQASVKSLSLSDIAAGEEVIFEKLKALAGNEVMVVNNTTYQELEKTCLVLHQLVKTGKGFNFRTAASFVSAFSGMLAQVWTPPGGKPGRGGLVIVGSYVKKSTAQLEELLKRQGIQAILVSVEVIIGSEAASRALLQRVVENVEMCLASGINPLVYTSRTLVSGDSPEASLAIGEKVTGFLVDVVDRLGIQPGFLIAKGGITSNDVAVKGLGMKRALVLGQVIPGVPVWKLGDEAKFPGIPYVVYPGNVGNEESLARVYDLFTSTPSLK
ncbi:four-carbon acid sugar kinase family protein [Cyclobacterium xiamenense]|uniref:four-carbon acid sugar kinase family protein n=1 Tax=Cyclobacterium xiamenense TaxID=1297121 RepID=UPI0035CF7CA0